MIFPSHTYGLPTDERTLPQALKEAGYRTLMVGKWHLGHADNKYWPQNRGFDHFYGNLVGEVDYFTNERGGLIDWQRNGKFFKEEGYYTTLIGNEAVKLIESQDGKQPFFLYFASLAPHAPYQAPKEYIDRYASIKDEQRRSYAAMITCLDDQVGRIVAALEKKRLRKNTLIIFSQRQRRRHERPVRQRLKSRGRACTKRRDRAGAKAPASNGVFRGGKALHEGGVRLPAFFNWPGRLSRPWSMNRCTWWTLCRRSCAGGRPGQPGPPLRRQERWPTLAEGSRRRTRTS